MVTFAKVQLVEVVCYKCGCVFGLGVGHRTTLQRDGHEFFCPNGHGQVFTNTAAKEIERLKNEIVRERARQDQLRADRDARSRQLVATRGAMTKLRKRVSAGLCPCCKRPFANVLRHMQHMHPEYAGSEST